MLSFPLHILPSNIISLADLANSVKLLVINKYGKRWNRMLCCNINHFQFSCILLLYVTRWSGLAFVRWCENSFLTKPGSPDCATHSEGFYLHWMGCTASLGKVKRAEGVCLLINILGGNSVDLLCPLLEYLMLKCHPDFLPLEFTSALLTAVCPMLMLSWYWMNYTPLLWKGKPRGLIHNNRGFQTVQRCECATKKLSACLLSHWRSKPSQPLLHNHQRCLLLHLPAAFWKTALLAVLNSLQTVRNWSVRIWYRKPYCVVLRK